MRRPGIGFGRRVGFRGVGGSAAAFDPLADALSPIFVSLPVSGDGSDNGTTLTIPNLLGGASLTATGVGRPTLSATALDGYRGIVPTGASVKIEGSLALTGLTAMTLYMLAYVPGNTSAGLFSAAVSGNQSASATYGTPSNAVVTFTRADNLGNPQVITQGVNNSLKVPRVLTFRFDTTRSVDESAPTRIDGDIGTVTRAGPTDTDGSLSTNTFVLGSNSGGGLFLQGAIGAIAIYGREHSDAEAARMEAYLLGLAGQSAAKEVMWTGDSITACSPSGGAEWREWIQDTYTAAAEANRWYHPIGPFATSFTTFTGDRCLAVGGRITSSIRADLVTYKIGTDYIPDVIPILIGINDIGGSGTGDLPALAVEYGGLLDDLKARVPNALIIAQKLMPRAGTTQETDWNDNYHDAMVAAAVSRGVNVISDDTLATLGGVTYIDALHPDAASAPVMGAAMYAKLREWCGVAP